MWIVLFYLKHGEENCVLDRNLVWLEKGPQIFKPKFRKWPSHKSTSVVAWGHGHREERTVKGAYRNF